MKYTHDSLKVEAYFYIHQKLETVDDVSVINENDIYQEFTYIRLKGSLPLIVQNGNVTEVLEEIRRNVRFLYFIENLN